LFVSLGLFTTQSFQKNDIIFTEIPYISIPIENKLQTKNQMKSSYPHQHTYTDRLCAYCAHPLLLPKMYQSDQIQSTQIEENKQFIIQMLQSQSELYPNDLPPLVEPVECEHCTTKYCNTTCYQSHVNEGHHIHCRDHQKLLFQIPNNETSQYWLTHSSGLSLFIYRLLLMLYSHYNHKTIIYANGLTLVDLLFHLPFTSTSASIIPPYFTSFHSYFRSLFSVTSTSNDMDTFEYWFSNDGFLHLLSLLSHTQMFSIVEPSLQAFVFNHLEQGDFIVTFDFQNQSIQSNTYGLFCLGSYMKSNNHSNVEQQKLSEFAVFDPSDAAFPISNHITFIASSDIEAGEQLFCSSTSLIE
jgi:hypothetical protein